MIDVPLFGSDESAALLLLHLQNEVLDPAGAIGSSGLAVRAREIGMVERAGRIADEARAVGAPVVHVVFAGVDGTARTTARVLRDGAAKAFAGWGVEPLPELYRSGDLVVPHDTMSAFAGTALAEVLRSRGIDRVALAGAATHLVVVASAFAAADEGFEVTVLGGCCVAPRDELHAFALQQLAAIGRVDDALDK